MTEQLSVPRRDGPGGAGLDLLHIVRINEEIKAVVAVAFKINIMALNAIFLAKRAGTAALGFGVLSNELRNFSGQLRETMLALNGLIHASVEEVSLLLRDLRYTAILRRAVEQTENGAAARAVLASREDRTQLCQERLSALRRRLRLAIEDASRLVELGGVLAKSAKIEAAYGATFAGSLSQVSGEFDGIVEEISVSLFSLRKSSFLKG